MAVHTTLAGLGREVIGDFLIAAEMCVKHKKPNADGGILGYPATLLLLAITDAIGHERKVEGGHTRLEVLRCSPFKELLAKSGQELSPKQVKNLTDWYRNKLAHNGLIAPGVSLKPETEGAPFSFDGDELNIIRVPVFYRLVRDAWDGGLKDTFTPRLRFEKGWPKNRAVLGIMSGASGMTEAGIVAAIKGQ